MKPIALFTISNCKWCDEAKAYLKIKKLKYNLIDLLKNKQASKDCQNMDVLVPVILTGDV